MENSAISDKDIERIVSAVSVKARADFHISEEEHYNSHKRLDKLLDVYDSAQSAFWKSFVAVVIVGALILAGIGITKGAK